MTAYQSIEQILAGQQLRYEAEQKAASDPQSLIDADMANLSGSTISGLMARGALSHLGLGGRPTPGRRHR